MQKFIEADYYELDWYYEECTDGKSFFFFFSSFLGAESEACKTGALSSNVLKMKYL